MNRFGRIAAALTPYLRGDAGPGSVILQHLQWSRVDRTLLAVVLILSGIGLVMIYSVTAAVSEQPAGSLPGQGLKVGVGLVCFLIGLLIDYHVYGRFAPALFVLGLVLLLLVFPFGHEVNGARRWITILGQSIQPVDFARLGLIIYLAFLLSKPKAKLMGFSTGLLPCVVALALVAGPVSKQPNLSSVLALSLVTGLMVVAGRVPWRQIGFVVLAGAAVLPFVVKGYQIRRLLDWFLFVVTGEGTRGENYQLYQSILAVGSGGLLGQGLGESRQKWLFLPEAHTDFIFAILGEEFGFVGAVGLIGLFVMLLWRAWVAARRAPDRFGHLLAVGIGASIAVYAGVNLAVATGVFPTTGLPLPLVSYGGTAVIVTLFSLGVLGNILSQGARSPGIAYGDQES